MYLTAEAFIFTVPQKILPLDLLTIVLFYSKKVILFLLQSNVFYFLTISLAKCGSGLSSEMFTNRVTSFLCAKLQKNFKQLAASGCDAVSLRNVCV